MTGAKKSKTNDAQKAIKRFERAVRAHEMRGSQPASEREDIVRELEEARAVLRAALMAVRSTSA